MPDIQIAFALSTTEALPEHIVQKIDQSENKGHFTDKSLLGLCSSGRSLPVEIFLHDHAMSALDPTGALLEEVAWHEVVHGIEGIKPDRKGGHTRDTPWSYQLQQRMLKIDEDNGHMLPEIVANSAYINYLRSGTSLQQNVSEIFARAAVVYMYEVKETGMAPTSAEEFMDLISKAITSESRDRKESNAFDFMMAAGTFSKAALKLFSDESDNFIQRVATLYGCEASL